MESGGLALRGDGLALRRVAPYTPPTGAGTGALAQHDTRVLLGQDPSSASGPMTTLLVLPADPM